MSTKSKVAGLIITVLTLSTPIVYADNGGSFAGGQDTATTAAAQPPSHQDHHQWHHGNKHQMMGKILDLTQDQQKQLKDVKQKQHEAMKSVFGQIKSNRMALNAEVVKATPDMAKINDLQTQFKTIQSQMTDNRLNSILEIKKIMTPEQFAGYMALEKERKFKARGQHKMMGRQNCGMKKHWKNHQHHSSDSQEHQDQ